MLRRSRLAGPAPLESPPEGAVVAPAEARVLETKPTKHAPPAEAPGHAMKTEHAEIVRTRLLARVETKARRPAREMDDSEHGLLLLRDEPEGVLFREARAFVDVKLPVAAAGGSTDVHHEDVEPRTVAPLGKQEERVDARGDETTLFDPEVPSGAQPPRVVPEPRTLEAPPQPIEERSPRAGATRGEFRDASFGLVPRGVLRFLRQD